MKHLARIGAGSSRVVFVADDQTAIKVAKNKKGLAQNELEIEVSQYDSDGAITAKSLTMMKITCGWKWNLQEKQSRLIFQT